MSYATYSDLTARESEDAIYAAADHNRDGVLDAADLLAIDKALADATGEMNSYIGQRHDLPLPTAPVWAVQICIDIALYRLSRMADALTNELRQRYADAVAFLKRVSKGEAGLGLPTTDTPPITAAGEIRGGEILVESQPRLFGRRRRGGR